MNAHILHHNSNLVRHMTHEISNTIYIMRKNKKYCSTYDYVLIHWYVVIFLLREESKL